MTPPFLKNKNDKGFQLRKTLIILLNRDVFISRKRLL